MSDAVNEKGSPTQTYERPTGLKGLYYHPATQVNRLFTSPSSCVLTCHSQQVVMLGLVCFMCPGQFLYNTHETHETNENLGLFNALNGLGGGGQVNKSTGANANSALYATFATCAFFAGYVLPLDHTFPRFNEDAVDPSTIN